MRARCLVPVAVIAVALAGCSRGPATRDVRSTGSPDGHATAVVTRGELTSLVTVPATIVAGADFTLTAPRSLTVRGLAGGRVTVVDDRGRRSELRAPAGARLRALRVPAGTRVPAGYPVADGRYDGFVLSATVPPALLLRLDDEPEWTRGQIDGGPGPFDCPLLDRVPAPGSEGSTLLCAVPRDLRVIAGLQGVMAVATQRVRDGLLLPVEAVAGTTQRGTVGRIGGDGRVAPVDVRLGPTDGARIVVLDGLAEGDRVSIPAPGLDEPGSAPEPDEHGHD